MEDDKYIEYRRILTSPTGVFYQESVMDLTVYSKNRAFRTIGSTKENSERYLIPINMDLTQIKEGRFNYKDYIIYYPEGKYYEDIYKDTITNDVFEQDRAKRRQMDNRATIEYIIANSLTNWKFLTVRAGFFILERLNDQAECACGIVHPTQNRSYMYIKKTQYLWKCYNNPQFKVVYEKPQKNITDHNGY